jgi:type I restriction enzyme R subunit
MPVDHSEANLEATIESVLADDHGYRVRAWNENYDRALCLDPELVVQFVLTTQPKIWEKLKQQHGEDVKSRFLKRLAKEVESRGTLDVLRRGVIDLGCKFDLAYFQPETGLNEEHRRLYKANTFSVVRQLHYSEKSANSIDLVLFLNGLPIATVELKNPETGQTVQHAIKQYKTDRDPKEPLLRFGRCLAHFAVDTDLAYMTTQLQGKRTFFLPFNRGCDGGAGNPVNEDGFRTDYLWKWTWQPDSLLEIIQHFIQSVDILDDEGKKTGKQKLIFPRYHQLKAVRGLVDHARSHGAGNNYLIEHSAGSGKSNTIAWTAHRLSGLHGADEKRVFDSIIVITDRRVLDRQLRQTVQSFEQVKGLVTAIESEKSTKLAEALQEGADIIITTIQTFPFVAEKVGEIQGKRFAILVDEAHSSVTGEATASMKSILSAKSLEEAQKQEQNGEKKDEEDSINAAIEESMAKRGRLPNVSFFAFTATPKNRTLELFGTKQPDGTFEPFDLYSMRQAIEEGFIKDVLRNYTTFKVYFGLNKKIEDDPEHPRKKAIALLRSYADLHPHGIQTKAELVVEHFEAHVTQHIKGQAKAMVVTRSRVHAVRYKQAFDAILKRDKLPHRALVAFSGTVKDPDTGLEFTEAGMNGAPETQTRNTFERAECKFLIVAEKFQTGFDQPLLHAMYVDKKLSGVNCVQTLSRLNRTHRDKENPVVLDFANEADEIRDAFQPYYDATFLTEATDPNKLYDLKRKAEEFLLYYQQDVDAFAAVYFGADPTQEKLRPILDVVVDRFGVADEDVQKQFRKAVTDFVRIYSFLSHILTFTDADLEKTYQFLRFLRPLLKPPKDRLPTEVLDEINMESYKVKQTASGKIVLLNKDGGLDPISDIGTGMVKEEDEAPLSAIISYINENFGTDFTDDDKVRYFLEDMERRILGDEGFGKAMDPEVNPSPENRRLIFGNFYQDVLEDMIDGHTEIYKKLATDDNFAKIFQVAMFRKVLAELERRGA